MANPDLNKDDIGRKGGATSGTSTMRRDTVGENVREGWQQFRSKVRSKWNQLTDNDLDQYQSRGRNDLVGYINERTGADRSIVERDIDTFARDTNYRWP